MADIIQVHTRQDTKKAAVKAKEVLQQGGLLVVPSDTVYGLSVDATNPQAVEKLIAFKSRPAGKPISVFVQDINAAKKIVYISADQENMLKNILPGRFTVVLPSKHTVSKLLESEKGTLGIRVIQHDFIASLTEIFPKAFTATSANISGTSPHYSISSLVNSLSGSKKKMIDLIIDYGKLPKNKPSTVVDFTSDEIKVLRQGDDALSEKKEYLSKSEEETMQIAGQTIKYYDKKRTKKPLVFILQGELGSGKTQFVKAIGKYFGISDIISPTFVIYYEYPIPNSAHFFFHVDLYNISEKNEFEYLGFEKMLKPGNVICIEWGEKSGEIGALLQQKAHIVYIDISYTHQSERIIQIR